MEVCPLGRRVPGLRVIEFGLVLDDCGSRASGFSVCYGMSTAQNSRYEAQDNHHSHVGVKGKLL